MTREESRREFLERLAAGTAAGAGLTLMTGSGVAASPVKGVLPKRTLGRTGVEVSILTFGCGSRWLMYKEEEKALEALNKAIDLGITYLDSAYSYGDGLSETRVGKLMATRRNEVFLATKIPDRTRDEFLRRFEASLKRLQTDHVDLVHIHSLARADDLARIEAPSGALKGLLEVREQKMARFIGMTSHTDGEVLAQAIERHDLNCVQMALNASQNGRFEELALPAARKKNLGIIAMKVMGQELLVGQETGKAPAEALLRYSMSLHVTTAVVGMPSLEMLAKNVEVARTFAPLSAKELDALRNSLEPSRKPLEKKLVGHLDGPTRTPELFWA
jgi:aryl-alcohol dehydrogenase-like predicted oxidoreductase